MKAKTESTHRDSRHGDAVIAVVIVGLVLFIIVALVAVGVLLYFSISKVQESKMKEALSKMESRMQLAGTHRRIAQVNAEIRMLSTSLESFQIDNNSYPVLIQTDVYSPQSNPTDFWYAGLAAGTGGYPGITRLTTPIAYMPMLPSDRLRGDGETFAYQYNSDGKSWYIVTSYGPDGDSDIPEELYTGAHLSASDADQERPAFKGAEMPLSEYTYDSSNGLISNGDIVRTGPGRGRQLMRRR